MIDNVNDKQQGPRFRQASVSKLPSRQRGVLGILGGLVLMLSVLFTALSVDTGRLMLEQRRLQSVADMAALDASSQSGGCGDGTLALAEAAAQASAGRNNHIVDGTKTLDVTLGNISIGAGGVRGFIASDPESSMAVEVRAGHTVPASLFAGGLLGNEVALQARAVAERQVLAGLSAGSLLVSIDSKASTLLNSLLGGILGSAVNLEVVSYQGIAATDVMLSDLIEASSGAGTVQELLDADLSLGEWLQIYADAANSSGAASAEVDAAMQALIDANISSLEVAFSDVLAVTVPNREEAASAHANLLDLIMTTALVANGNNALTLPLAVNLPGGLLNVNTLLYVIEPPQIAIGPPGKDEDGNWLTRMQTAQVRLDSRVQGEVDLNVLGLLGARATVDIGLGVEVAQGEAWLDNIQCRNALDPRAIVTVGAQPGVANVVLTRASDPSAAAARIDVSAIVLLLRVPVAVVTVGLDLPLENPTESELVYEIDTNDTDALPVAQRASSGAGASLDNGLAGLSDSLVVDVELLGISIGVGAILSPILGDLLVPLLTQLGTEVLDPLLHLLGIEIGSLDVQLFTLDIGRPELLI